MQIARWYFPVLCVVLLVPQHVVAEVSAPTPPPVEQPVAPPAAEPTPLERRIADEGAIERTRFGLAPYKPNYILPLSYNSRPNQSDQALGETEIKYQLSIKALLADKVFDKGKLYFGYTQQSYWQAFNHAVSAPFRETVYEPELMLSFLYTKDAEVPRARGIVLGFSHQSNGRVQPESRSWNRVYVNWIREYGDFFFSLKPWWRIPEPTKNAPSDPGGDDNPDIEDYAGRVEMTAVWALGEQRIGLMVRNNLKADNRGAAQLDWSFPINGKLQGYVQVYHGYGENLIDYNHYVKRIGVGLMLNNWL